MALRLHVCVWTAHFQGCCGERRGLHAKQGLWLHDLRGEFSLSNSACLKRLRPVRARDVNATQRRRPRAKAESAGEPKPKIRHGLQSPCWTDCPPGARKSCLNGLYLSNASAALGLKSRGCGNTSTIVAPAAGNVDRQVLRPFAPSGSPTGRARPLFRFPASHTIWCTTSPWCARGDHCDHTHVGPLRTTWARAGTCWRVHRQPWPDGWLDEAAA